MVKNEKSKMWVDRILGFVVGGALVLLISSVGVVSPLKTENTALKTQLSEIQNGAPRLLSEAKAFVESKNYDSALKTLDTLFLQQPISTEAAEGKKMYATIEATVKQKNLKWEAVVGSLKTSWERTKATELRGKMEQDMTDTLNREWENSKDTIKKEWEAKQL